MFNRFYRLFKKYYFKLLRTDGSPYSVAMAIGLGFFIGCFLPIGHTPVIIILAIVFRTDKVLAFAATWISNPYTIPFMYPFFCYIGSKFLGSDLSFRSIEHQTMYVIHHFSWHNFDFLIGEFAVAYLIGGGIFGTLFGVIGYFVAYKMVLHYRKKKVEHAEYVRKKMN